MATRCKPLLDSDWPAIKSLKMPNKSLDLSGGGVKSLPIVDLIRAAALTQPLCGF
jgi:hypothetical protein